VNEDPHNVVLLLMATIGVPAALLAVSIVGATLWRARGAAFTRVAAPAQLLYAGWWAAFLGLATALLFGVSTVSAVTLLFVAGAVLVAPRAREASASLAVVRAVTGAAALVASVLLVLASLSVAADVKLASAVASGDGAGMTAAARIAPWHVQAQYQATSVAARNALVALQSGAPDGEALAQQAEQRIVALIAMNPHEYYAQSLMAFFLAQYGAIQQTAGSAQAPATLQRAKKAADAALRMYPRSPEAAYLKAFAEYHLGDNNAAIATLGPLWDVDPRFAEAGLLYVEVLDRAGRPAEALMRLKTLEQRLPGNVRVQEMARALSTSDTAK
jgi:hypothetical protein